MFSPSSSAYQLGLSARKELADNMNNSTVRATRASIELGNIPLVVFQLPNGMYRLSQTLSTNAVDKDETSFRDFLKGKSPEALPFKDFKAEKWTVEGSNGKANLVSIEVTIAYWTKEAITGNAKAARILGACAVEAIERRADRAFGVQRDEADYQAKMKARIDGKVVRQSLTDAIKDYILRHPELSSNDKKWLYKNCSDKTNKIILGKIAKKAAEELGCEHAQLRDYLQAEQLIRISYLEDVTVKLIHLQDIHPLQAVIQAANRLLLDFEE
jgi:hypothetical protein